jgi:carbonic anhydrase
MSLIAPAAASLGGPVDPDCAGDITRLERASIVATLENLKTFPWIRARADAGKLQLLGAYFDVATGVLMALDPDNGAFVPLNEAAA